MTTVELLVQTIAGNLEMLKGHIADFSDQDMLVRPVPSANHTLWQIGHLCGAEAWMVNQVKPGAVKVPAGFAEKFSKETAKIDDPKAFPTKAEVLAAYDAVRADVITWAKSLTPADLEKPGPEPMRNFTPTIGSLLALFPAHTGMHVGQIQVIRRKLGRPVMF